MPTSSAISPSSADESPVLDAHTHAFPNSLAAHAIASLTQGAQSYPVCAHQDGTVVALVAAMDRTGIGRAIVCSVATRPTQVGRITEWSASIASARLIPFASIHPDFESPETEVERMAGLGLRGIKFHPQYMNCPADDPRAVRIARAAARCGLAMTVHAGHDLAFAASDIASPQRLLALHRAVPELRLLACHLGGWRQWEAALECLIGLPIYLETSFCLGQCPPPLLERIIALHPPEYLLFGSDSPWADQQEELARFRALPLSDEIRRQVLWGNPHRFLNLPAGDQLVRSE